MQVAPLVRKRREEKPHGWCRLLRGPQHYQRRLPAFVRLPAPSLVQQTRRGRVEAVPVLADPAHGGGEGRATRPDERGRVREDLLGQRGGRREWVGGPRSPFAALPPPRAPHLYVLRGEARLGRRHVEVDVDEASEGAGDRLRALAARLLGGDGHGDVGGDVLMGGEEKWWN